MSKFYLERMVQRRKELNLTQSELAESSGVSLSIIKQLEAGNSKTSEEKFTLLEDALNCEAGYLYDPDFRNTVVISLANNKGGPGKTTVCVNLAHAMSTMDKRILVIDSDMQMNTTRTLGLDRDEEKSIYRAFQKEESLVNYIKPTAYENLDIIISDYNMATAELMFSTKVLRETLFKRMIDPIIDLGIYDFIFIDTNPTLGIVNLNCIGASDYALVPVELTIFGIDGLTTLTNFFRDAVSKINPAFRVLGVLFNKVDLRENLTEDATKVILEVFGDILLETEIPVDAAIKKAQWERKPILEYNSKTKSGKVSIELAKEILSLI